MQSNKEICALESLIIKNAYINFHLEEFYSSFVQCEHASFYQSRKLDSGSLASRAFESHYRDFTT